MNKFLISFLAGFIGISFLLIWIVYRQNIKLSEYEKEKSILLTQLSSSNNAFGEASASRDSAVHVLSGIKEYRTLVDYMKYRDSISSGLKYKIGDVVLIKPDSSKAVIQDIQMGGNKNEFYIRFIVRTKHGEETITPQILF